MQKYLSVLQDKALEKENLSKSLQKQIDTHEANLQKHSELKNAIDNDLVENPDEASENLKQYEEILNNTDADLCKKLKKFDTEKYAATLKYLSKAQSNNSKLNGGKTTAKSRKQTEPVVASQGTIVQTPPQTPTATVDGKEVEVIEEQPKKGMSGLTKFAMVLGLAALAGLGIAVAVNVNKE